MVGSLMYIIRVGTLLPCMDPHSLAEPLQPSLQRQDNRAIFAAARVAVLTRGSRRNRSETATLSPPPSLQLPPPPALALAAVAPSQVSLQPPGAAASGSAAVTAAAEAAVTAARIRRCLRARAGRLPKPGGIRLTRTLRVSRGHAHVQRAVYRPTLHST